MWGKKTVRGFMLNDALLLFYNQGCIMYMLKKSYNMYTHSDEFIIHLLSVQVPRDQCDSTGSVHVVLYHGDRNWNKAV